MTGGRKVGKFTDKLSRKTRKNPEVVLDERQIHNYEICLPEYSNNLKICAYQ